MTKKRASPNPPVPTIAVEHFDREVLHEWDFVQRGKALMDDGILHADSATFWFGLHSTMSALGNISKVFFPSGGSNPRCAHMRKLHGVSDQSLLGNRRVRNGLEHFDERVDTWAATSANHNMADRIVLGPPWSIGFVASDVGRHFDPTTAVMSVFGEAIDLRALIAEAEAIVARVQAAQQQRETARFGRH